MTTYSEDPFETVKARIISGDERQVVGVSGKAGRVRLVETTE